MKRVIIEYAGSVIAIIGTIGFLSVAGMMFGGKGVLAEFITQVLGGL